MAPDDTHFEPAIVQAATRGAWIGAIGVIATFLVAIILTNASMDLMAVATFAAIFGGSAFGAMLGAASAASSEAIPLPVRTKP